MRVSTRSLQAKVILLMGGTVVLVVTVSTYLALLLTSDPIEAELYRKALVQADLTAHQTVENGQLQSPPALLAALRKAKRVFPGLKEAAVYAQVPQHALVTATDLKAAPIELDSLPDIRQQNAYTKPNDNQVTIETPDSRFWIISTEIRGRGVKLGSLVLKVSKSPLNAVTWQVVEQDLFLLLASLGTMILVIHVFFLRGIRAPVKDMIRVMESAESGQLDVRTRARSRDEVGQLGLHLNRMLARIESFNTELARKVEDATAELARRNEELRRINEELFETQKKLAHSERLAVAGQLAASLAHEIGTPLNSISGHVQLLARQESGDEVAVRRLRIIETQIESIVRSVKQLLSWTHRLNLQIAPVALRHLLEESVLLSSPGLRSRKIAVRTDWPSEPIRVRADAGYLQQVFLNLINNSMDAMPRGGELRLRLRVAAGSDPDQVIVEIEDTGEGIPPETLSHIFEPMFTTKRMGTGTGLGLAVCDQVVREHGGTIQVESAVGRGTLFKIVLPVRPREKAEALAGRGVTAAKVT